MKTRILFNPRTARYLVDYSVQSFPWRIWHQEGDSDYMPPTYATEDEARQRAATMHAQYADQQRKPDRWVVI